MLNKRTLYRSLSAALLIQVFVFMTFLPGAGYLYANMRAPYHRTYKDSSALHKSGELVLDSENLYFSFDRYFTGDVGVVTAEKNYCRVKAVYQVESDSDMTAEFDFISPSAGDAFAGINGTPSVISTTELAKDPDSSKLKWNTFYGDLYSLKFSGKLVKGKNTITVKYIQPAGVTETSYGYFKKSRWFTYVGYEFSPIKEWKRSGSFTADIEVSVPYNWGTADSIFGPDIVPGVTGFDNENKRRYMPEVFETRKTGGSLIQRFRFTGELPDKLTVSVSEK